MNNMNPYAALVKISQEISSRRGTASLLDRAMDIAMEALPAERGFILLRSDRESAWQAVSARNISKETISGIREISSSAVNRVLQSGEALLTLDARADERFSGAESIMVQEIRSLACTPLIVEGEVLGAIYLDTQAGSGAFDDQTLEFLAAFAGQVAIAIEKSRMLQDLSGENDRLKRRLELSSSFPEIIGESRAIREILEMVEAVADSMAAVLIEGESGTGKELVARALHSRSSRREKPFIPVFCGSLSEHLLESELFGHKRGAFTGAIEDKRGLFEEADGGTLFLDEIGDIDAGTQAKLLRVIQEGEIKRVGESQLRKVEVRIVSATNRDLWDEVQGGRFREDLYYRLNVINLKMPPLRERQEDIPLLVEHFLQRFARRNGRPVQEFSPLAMKGFMSYHWPGNVRELENAVERAVILSRTAGVQPLTPGGSAPRAEMLIGKPLREIEKIVVMQTLETMQFNRTRAAEILNVSRRWLQYRLKEWGITAE